MDAEARRTRRALLGWLALVVAAPASAKTKRARLERARDLRRDLVAHQDAEAVLLLFSLPGCAYCAVVRQNYLAPLARDPAYAPRLMIRELGLDDDAALVDFDGRPASGRALARRYGAIVAPTVVFLGGDGQPLAEPLVGGDVAGFYGGYLDAALGKALAEAHRRAGR